MSICCRFVVDFRFAVDFLCGIVVQLSISCRLVVDLLRISLLLYDNSTTNRTNGVRP